MEWETKAEREEGEEEEEERKTEEWEVRQGEEAGKAREEQMQKLRPTKGSLRTYRTGSNLAL